ncbi:MAG: hypothetical protein WDO19_30535 [Bacteroidota bacterium]
MKKGFENDPAVKKSLATPGLKFIIQTVDSVPGRDISWRADEAFDSIINAGNDKKERRKRAVFVLVSQSPSLIQVRVGKDLYLKSYFGGITSGRRYLEIQKLAQNNELAPVVTVMLGYLAEQIPHTYNHSFWRDFLYNDIIQELYFELRELETPSEGFYGNFILAPLIKGNLFLHNLSGGWPLPFIISTMIALLLGSACKKIIANLLKPLAKRNATIFISPQQSSQFWLNLALQCHLCRRFYYYQVREWKTSFPSIASE